MTELSTSRQPVDVYRNLNNCRLSIKSRRTKDYGTVIGYADKVHLQDVEFVVQPAGRERVLEEERKNVHAFARGNLCPESEFPEQECTREVTYNPYKYETFVLKDSESPIHQADYVLVSTDSGVLVPEPQ